MAGRSSRLATTVDFDNCKKSRWRMKVKGRRARSGKEGKSGESTCAEAVAGRSRAFRWAESDAALRVHTYRDGRARPRESRQIEISDRVTSEQVTAGRRCWATQEQRHGAGGGRGHCDWDGRSKAALLARDGHKNRCAAALGPNPKQVAPGQRTKRALRCSRQLARLAMFGALGQRGACVGDTLLAEEHATRQLATAAVRQASHGSRELSATPTMRRSAKANAPWTFSAPAPAPSREGLQRVADKCGENR
jgi:hypothetical protein